MELREEQLYFSLNCDRHEAILGRECTGALALKPRHWTEVSGQLHTPTSLRLEKNPPVPIEWEASWVHSWSGRVEVEKRSLAQANLILQPVV